MGSSPAPIAGKSSLGSVARVNRERPARRLSWPLSPLLSSWICAPSGSFRTMS